MKKILLLAAIAASSITASAASFGDYFALTYEEQALENGQTLTVATYWDPILKEYPEMNIPGYTPSYMAQAKIKATNIYDEAMDIAFVLTCVDNATEKFQLCYEFDSAPGNCLGPKNGKVTSPDNLDSIDPDGGYIIMDVDQTSFTDLTPVTMKLDLYVTEGGDKIEGTDTTVYIQFTHESDITAAVNGIQAENGSEEYFNLQGIRVTQPERGNIYIVRTGSKISKRIF